MIGDNMILTPIIHHFHSNAYISTVEMIDDNTILTPIIHHFHSNAYIVTVEMIDDNTILTSIIHHFHSNAYRPVPSQATFLGWDGDPKRVVDYVYIAVYSCL